MGSEDSSLVVLVVYRALTLLVGLALVFMGYRLFLAGFSRQAGDVEAGVRGLKLTIRRAAPGTVFAALGAAVMVAGIWKGLSYQSEEPVAPQSPSALQQSSSSPSDSVRGILWRVANGQSIGVNERAAVATWLAQFSGNPSVAGIRRKTAAAKK